MSVEKAVGLGITGNEISKKITGTSEVSPERTAIATGTGVALGAAASGALIVAGVAATPVTVPLALASGAVAFLASLFD
ncbi:hypothetical protein [Aeromonas caviae]|uniref:hypothetical protein n=1 Tax=Aeromonas caviae TaxID=648 RepID=UPI002B49CDFF|nr:hypothetical protein [Aeromonas caviae]